MNMTYRKDNRGFTLLEVLIALLIFSFGLLGLAGLLVVSVQTNHSAYLRTQASFLAQTMADRMRANVIGIWGNAYNGTYTSGSGGATSSCLNTASCTPAQVAARDTRIWSTQLGDFLPSSSGIIACTPPAIMPTADQIVTRPPYQGQCTITITWNESRLDRQSTAQPETFAWVFQP